MSAVPDGLSAAGVTTTTINWFYPQGLVCLSFSQSFTDPPHTRTEGCFRGSNQPRVQAELESYPEPSKKLWLRDLCRLCVVPPLLVMSL